MDSCVVYMHALKGKQLYSGSSGTQNSKGVSILGRVSWPQVQLGL